MSMSMRTMKTQMRGALTKNGKPRMWTGVPVGLVTPLAVGKLAQMYVASATASATTTDAGFNLMDTAKTLNTVAMLSPFVLALPFLFFKKTRPAAFGIIGGGLAGDLIWSLTGTPATGSSTTQGALGAYRAKVLRGAAVRVL